jgi:hypothetical protein
MKRHLVGAAVVAFLIGMVGGCGDTDKGVSRPPAPDKEQRQKMQRDNERGMKEAGLDKRDADKGKTGSKEDKKNDEK